MSIKKIFLTILLFIIVGTSLFIIIKVPQIEKNTANNVSDRLNKVNNDKLNVVATNFASYDFVRAIAKDNVNLKYLLGPGKDAHSYDPTAQDLISIQKSDVCIYIGGEMEKWSDKVFSAIDTSKTKVFCIADYVDKVKEQEVDGAQEEEHEEEHLADDLNAFDEHIWTSPSNAIKMVEALRDLLIELDGKNKDVYTKNASDYINEIEQVREKIKEVVDNKVRNRLIFGDKMPMQYFLDEFSLTASAAFSGCSTETEPSAATITYLINRVKEENIPVVLYIELNNGKVAETIAKEAGDNVKTMQIQTLHNISKDDFDNGETYISLMSRNIDVLKIALQ